MRDVMLYLDASSAPKAEPEPLSEREPPSLTLLLASPRGFCAGVRRAIDAVLDALELHGAPVYVRRPIVHNLAVVRSLEARGAIFVQELEEVPEGSVVVLSAHGVAPAIAAEARRRRLTAYDAVCPLVSKVHREVLRHNRDGRHVILVGHSGHPEVEGTLGRIPASSATLISSAEEVLELDFEEARPLAYAIQTTYSVEEADDIGRALEKRFSNLASPPSSDICYATTNRQRAVREIAPGADAMIVVGEHFSSNACRLAEVARAAGCASVQLVADAEEIDWSRLPRGGTIGITAAASTPEASVENVVQAFRSRYSVDLREVESLRETASFSPVRIR